MSAVRLPDWLEPVVQQALVNASRQGVLTVRPSASSEAVANVKYEEWIATLRGRLDSWAARISHANRPDAFPSVRRQALTDVADELRALLKQLELS